MSFSKTKEGCLQKEEVVENENVGKKKRSQLLRENKRIRTLKKKFNMPLRRALFEVKQKGKVFFLLWAKPKKGVFFV